MQINSHTTGERSQAVEHLKYTEKNDLIIYDRGYPAVWFFRLHQVKNINFCARVTLDSSNTLKAFLRSGKNEDTVFLPCVDKSLKYCLREGLSISPLKVRLIRITLPSGQTEILMTSLFDKNIYPYEIFKSLYFQRWGVEEDYKIISTVVNAYRPGRSFIRIDKRANRNRAKYNMAYKMLG